MRIKIMYGKCLAHSKHSGSVCFRYCHTRISAVCSLRPYRELCPWCWPVTKSCYCLVNSMDEDTEKLVITSADGRTNQRRLGVRGPAAPADQGSQQVRTRCSRPCVDCECEKRALLLHLFLPELVQIASCGPSCTRRDPT